MNTHDPIANARRRAKALSRSTDLTYQQALDAIAREDGHRHWAAFVSSREEAPVRSVPTAPSTPADASDWRIVHLERMAGARHSPIDEWCIRHVGGPIARACLSVGPTWTTAMVIAVHLLTAFLMQIVGDGSAAAFLLMACVVSPYLIGMNVAKPDGREQRMVRRAMISFGIMWSLITFATAIGSSMETAPFESARWKPLIILLSLYPVIVLPYITQAAAAWAGRAGRRRTGGSMAAG